MAWVNPPAMGCRFSFLHLPCARCGHTMNVFQDLLIVFGGFDGKRWLSDLHKFDTQTLMWSQQNMQGDPPQPRQYHASSIIGSNLYIYGGFNGSYWLSDLIVADIQEGRWNYPITYGNQPCAKEGLAMAAVETYLFVHGGWNGITNGDLHRFDTLNNEWTLVQIEGKKPALCGHSITRVNDKLFVFGGYDGTKWANSLYILDPLKDKTWTEPNVFGVPMARGYHSAVLYNKYILVFAGFNGSDVLNDIVALDIETLTWFLPDTCSGYFPQARNAHSMVLHGSQLYLFGGYNGSRDTNELYILETSAFSSLHEDLKLAYTNSSWHDTILYSSSGCIHVHSVILKSRAPLLFCRLIDNNPSFIQNKITATLNMGNISFETLKLFCEYLYCDLNRERIHSYLAEELFSVAREFELQRLKFLCAKVLLRYDDIIRESSLASDIMKCKDEVFLSDFTIYVKSSVYKVHKVIISARCTFFRMLLNSGMKDASKSSIRFNDFDPKAFDIIIEWMYSDKFLPLFSENSLDLLTGKELLSATNFLQLESLTRITEITLWKLIDDKNAFKLLEISCLFSTSQLKSYCVSYILRQFDKSYILRELSLLNSNAQEELAKFLPKHARRHNVSWMSSDLHLVKYEKNDENTEKKEPVMIYGRLFESLRIKKKMVIKASNPLINKEFYNSSTLPSNFALKPYYRTPISLKLKPKIELNVRGIKAGGIFSMPDPNKNQKQYHRKPRSYKSLTQAAKTDRNEEKHDFYIKGFGSNRRGKSRMSSLVNSTTQSRYVLGSAGFQIYCSADILSKQLMLPVIK